MLDVEGSILRWTDTLALLAKLDPADIPLPPSPDLRPSDIPLPATPQSATATLLSPELKPSGSTSLFNTPRNLASKLPSIARASTPTAAAPAGDAGKRVDSDRDLFSLGLSGAITPAADGAGNETPGHTMADTEALLARVDEQTKPLSEGENPADDTPNGTAENGNLPATDTEPQPSEEPVKPEVEIEDVSTLSREELEEKYKALSERANKADVILKSTSPLLNEGIADADALEGWVKMISGKAEMGPTEIKRLNDKLARK